MTEASELIARSPVGLFQAKPDGTIVHANAALAHLVGYSVEELLAKNIRDLYVDPSQRGRDGERVRWRHKDGRELSVQVFADAWVVDCTAADELVRVSTLLDLCMQLTPAIYWIVDRDLRIVRAVGAIGKILGYPDDTYVGNTLAEVHTIEPGTHGSVEPHTRALAGESVSYETRYRGKLLVNKLAPYRTAGGEIIGVVGVCIDATQARELESRMIDAQRAESLGVLAGGLAHDFNNLLVAVIGSADIALRDLPPGAPVRSTIENIRTAGLRAAELTDQLLAYAGRGGRGTTRIYPAVVVAELLRILGPSLERITTKVEVPTDLSVRGDPGQFHQVLLNLVGNAREAGARSITLSARAVTHDGAHHDDDMLEAAAGDYISLVVTDDGPGFDRETRRHVFEPFFTTKATGHGLGLAAVLGIVRAHGGGIRVTATPGHGASFEVLWPAAHPRARSNPSSAPPIGPAPRTVLVVDDEDLVRDVLARMIEELGYTAITAADGMRALALLDERQVDAVLVDLTMPAMSGADVVAAIRVRRPGLPVVLCSGFDRGGRGPVAADAYLPKPFRIEALERTLAKLLPLRSV